MQTSQETKSQKKNNKKKEEEKVGSYTTDRIKKDIKIIDETGGASAEIYLRNKEFQEDDYGKTFLYLTSDFQYSTANSMADMNKGFLMADRLSPKKDLSKREKILQKYNSQMKNLKSQMQSCVNRKSYANSLLVTMDHEFETLTDSIKLEESSLLLLNNSLQAIKHIVESTCSSEDLINHFKEFYLEFKARDKESRKLVQCNNLSNSFKTSEANLNNLGCLLSEDFKIATLLLKMLSSLLSKECRDVDFSQNPLHMFDTIANFREFLLKILEDSVASFAGDEGDGLFGYSRLQEKEFENGKKTVDAYLTILLQNTIYHHLRQFISVKWNPMTQHNLTDFFEKWINLMPLRLYIHILVSYVEPKLKFEINKVSISNIVESSFYSWISPWIKIFDQISAQHNLKICDSLKVTIRLCLIQILKEWHPSNTEITTEIQKWRTIYDENSWSSLIYQSIIPKLAHSLKQLKINPQNQQIEPINWTLKWTSHLGIDSLANLFTQNFLPNWLQTLKVWLDNPNADFSEIMEWYQGWKSMLPSKIIQHESVQKFLNGALILINSKISN